MGVTRCSLGKSSGTRSAAICRAAPPSNGMTVGRGGLCAVAPMKTSVDPSPVTTGDQPNSAPAVITCGSALSIATRTACLRSMSSGSSPALAVNKSQRPS